MWMRYYFGRRARHLGIGALSCVMCAAYAGETRSNMVGVGVGLPYGGLGARYIMPIDEVRQLYVGAGLFAYSSSNGTWVGFSVGFDQQINNSRHSLGLSTGTVGAESWSFGKVTYYGMAANYTYHFSGFAERSGLVGLSAYVGDADRDHPFVRNRRYGIATVLGYQF